MGLLTDEQRNELNATGELRLIDVESQREFVAVPAEIFEKWRRLLSDDKITDEERTRLAWEAGKSIGWDDPIMDEYNNYDELGNK